MASPDVGSAESGDLAELLDLPGWARDDQVVVAFSGGLTAGESEVLAVAFDADDG